MKHLKSAVLVVMMCPVVALGAPKVIVTDASSSYGDDSVRVHYLTNDSGTFVEGSVVTVYIASAGASPQAIRDAITAAVLAQTNYDLSLSLTADDVLVTWPALGALEGKALEGNLSPTIDGKTVGNTTVFTNHSGRDFIVTNVIAVSTAVSGLGTAPLMTVGKTASAYNDIATSVSLVGLGAVGNTMKVTLSGSAPVVHDGENVVCRVATAAILTTTFNFQCLVQGAYIN